MPLTDTAIESVPSTSRWGRIFSWAASAVGILGTTVGATYGAMRLFSNNTSNIDVSQLNNNLLSAPDHAGLIINPSTSLSSLVSQTPTKFETLVQDSLLTSITPLPHGFPKTPNTKIENLVDTTNSKTASRRLMTNPPVVVNPIADQVIDASATYSQVIDAANIFSGDIENILVSGQNQVSLPSWLSYHPKANGLATTTAPKKIIVRGDIAYIIPTTVRAGDLGYISIFDVTDSNNPVLLNSYPIVNTPSAIAFNGNVAFIPVVIQRSPYYLVAYNVTNYINFIPVGNCSLEYNYVSDIIPFDNCTLIALAANSILLTIDTTSLSNMKVVNSFSVTTVGISIRAYALNDTTLFVTDGQNIHALDLSNPNNITRLATFSQLSGAFEYNGIAVLGNTVYTGAYAYLYPTRWAIQLYDFSNGSTFIPLFNYVVPFAAQNFVIQDFMLYLTLGAQGTTTNVKQVLVFSILNPHILTLIASYDLPGSPYSLSVANKNIYVTEGDSWNGFQIINPTQGLLTGFPTLTLLGNTYSILVQATDKLGRSATTSFNLYIDRVPQPIVNTLLDQSLRTGQPFTLVFSSRALYTHSDATPLQLSAAQSDGKPLPTWLTFSMSPTIVGYFSRAYTSQVFTSGEILFVSENGFEVVNIADPANPISLGAFSLTGYMGIVTLMENLLYVQTRDMLVEFDITNSTDIIVTDVYLLPGPFQIRFINDSTLCLFTTDPSFAWTGFLLANLNNANGLSILANHTFSNIYGQYLLRDLYVTGNNIYFAVSSGPFRNFVWPVDISNFNNIIPYDIYITKGVAWNIVIGGNIAVLLEFSPPGVEFVDLTNPANLTYLSIFPTDHTIGSIAVAGPTLYIYSSPISELLILNIRDPRHPILLGQSTNLGSFTTITPDGTLAYLTGRNRYGVEIIDLTQAEFSGTPQAGMGTNFGDEGNYPIRLTATNIMGGTVDSAFTIRVEGAPRFMVNSSLLILQATVGKTLSFSVNTITRDPNNDPITFYATEIDGSSLRGPSLNSINGNLIWTPSPTDAGNKTFIMFVTDNIAGTNQLTFTIHVARGPQVVLTIPTPPVAILNQDTPIVLPPNFIISPDNLPLNFTANLLGGNLPLPSWITPYLQNAANITFVVSPTVVGSTVVQIIATDSNNAQASAFFTINAANLYPLQLSVPPFDQSATAGTKFSTAISQNTFTNPNGDGQIYYSVQIEGNADWLHWDATSHTLSGKPGHGDTDFYKIRVIPITLTGSTCSTQQQANTTCISSSTKFNINVGGTSWGQYVVTYATSTLSGLSIVGGILLWYIHRAKVIDASVVPVNDQTFKRELDVPVERVGIVHALRNKDRSNWDPRFWRKGYAPLPGGNKLPDGFCYDEDTNSLRASGQGPQKPGEWVVQVLDAANASNILREFNLRVTPSAAGHFSPRSKQSLLKQERPSEIELVSAHIEPDEDEKIDRESSMSRPSASQ